MALGVDISNHMPLGILSLLISFLGFGRAETGKIFAGYMRFPVVWGQNKWGF